MAKLSNLKKPKRTSFFFRGEQIEFEYNSAVLTQDYIDEYEAFFKALADENSPGSKKMPELRKHVARRVTWIDFQDDDENDIPVGRAIEELTWDELTEIDSAITIDIRRQQNPTPPTGQSVSSG